MTLIERIKENPIGMANLVYIIFPILSLTVLGHRGPLWRYIGYRSIYDKLLNDDLCKFI